VIDHGLCTPPRGVAICKTLNRFGRWQLDDNDRKPALAFLSEDPEDDTAAIIWIVDCKCVGPGGNCPRARMFRAAGAKYDSASVKLRPAVAAASSSKPAKSHSGGAWTKGQSVEVQPEAKAPWEPAIYVGKASIRGWHTVKLRGLDVQEDTCEITLAMRPDTFVTIPARRIRQR